VPRFPSVAEAVFLRARWMFKLWCRAEGFPDDEMSRLHCCPLDVEYPGGPTCSPVRDVAANLTRNGLPVVKRFH
jgi:hypothetical protein